MISIVTPCKNIISEGRQEFFRKMMQALTQQTYQEFEHIVVDGGSEDGTLELLQEYKEKGLIATLISEKDHNLHEAINRGLRLAKGGYIYIMNSDDYFATDTFFERSLDAIQKHGVDFTHGDRVIVKRDGTKPSVKRGDERVAFFRMPFRWQTMIIKKEVYDEIGPLDEKYEIVSDYKFMMEMLLRGKRGHYFSERLIYSLDGGITQDRKKCIDEVSAMLYETYGRKYGLTIEECATIYARKITPELFSKIISDVTEEKIRDSLTYCYRIVQKVENRESESSSFPQVPLENFSRGVCNVEVPELGEKINGKIRNNWIIEHDSKRYRVILTTDLQYAYIRPICTIPGKGHISNLISAYWFGRTKDIVKNHMVAIPHPNVLIAHQAKLVFPVEVVLRRYIAQGSTPTSVYHNYFHNGRRIIYGISFPDGMLPNQEFPMGTIITPTTKAKDGHDQELDDGQARKIVDGLSRDGIWDELKAAAHKVFERARVECLTKGLILADTKFEFGLDENGNLMIVDELLTPDCSRYWLKDAYEQEFAKGDEFGIRKNSLISWLESKRFTGDGEVPRVDDRIVDETGSVYRIPYKMITGQGVASSDEEEIRQSLKREKIIKSIREANSR